MRRWILITIIVVVAVAGGAAWWAISRSTATNRNLRTVTVEPRTVKQDIAFTGRLAPATSSNISFELPGTVANLFVDEGEVVAAGQSLAVLDTSSISLELAAARATTASSQDQTKLAWEQAQKEYEFTRATNAQTVAKRRQAVADAKQELDQAKAVHQQRAAESGDDAALTEAAIATLRAQETAWHTAQKTLTETVASVAQSNAAAAAAAETARATYLATTQTAREVAGLSTLEAQEGLVANRSSKHTLRAPFAGTVTTRHKAVGEAALAGQPVVTLATVDQLELTASVTETDAVKLRVGLPATVTFDALPTTQQWTATISFVAPAANVEEGVSNYTIKLALTGTISELPPGLSANITVHAAQVENALAIPRRAIIVRDTRETVLILNDDGTTREQTVETGLIGSDGTVEIKAGVQPGNRVVVNPSELESDDDTANN